MIKRQSSAFAVPNPTPVLFLMAAILAWNFTGADKSPFSQTAALIVLSVVVAGLIYLLARRPVLAVIMLIASGAAARFYVEIFGMKARPEHFAIVLFGLALPFWPRKQWEKPYWIFPDLLLVLYIASNLASSLFMSIAPGKTIRWALQQTLVILPYFLLRLFCTDYERFRKCFNILLVVGAAQAGIGVFCFLSNLLFGTTFGIEIEQYGTIPGTFGVAYEANILGAISAASFVMMLAVYLKKRRPILLWGTAITYAGVVVALARSAIGATVVALACLAVLSIKPKLIDWRALKVLGGTLLISTLILIPAVMPLYVERFSTLGVSDVSADYDTVGRIVILATAVDGIIAHPLLGNGTASFQLLSSAEDLGFADLGKGTWIGNTEMRVLHDTGIVGFTLFLCVAGSLAWRAWKILKRELRPELLALLLGCVVYAVTFQATEGTLLAFFWVHFGLLGCAVSIDQNSEVNRGASRGFERPSGAAYA